MKKQMEKFFRRYRLHKNLDNEESIQFVQLVEEIVDNLPTIEGDLIRERYMTRDADYIADRYIYEFVLPMNNRTYRETRTKSFEKLVIMLESAGVELHE